MALFPFRRAALAAVLALTAGTAAAQPADPFALPDAAAVDWEIVQRFMPFAGLDDPEGTFAAYAFRPGESASDWHRRLWTRDGDGFASPYAAALAANRRDRLPWDATGQHASRAVTEAVRRETDPAYRIAVRLAYPHEGPCIWTVDGAPTRVADCTGPHRRDIALAGSTVSLRFDGGLGGVTLRLVPTHEVIVALGDSFGSGEGNPDLPALWDADWDYVADGAVGRTTWLARMNPLVIDREARWLDERCHRSFFSHQTLTAFRIASEDRHRLVSYLHYACTGAEMFDGVLLPQIAPGRVRGKGEAEGANRYSQINAAVLDLCRAPRLTYESATPQVIGGQNLWALHRRGGLHVPRPPFGRMGPDSFLSLFDEFDNTLRRYWQDDTAPRGGFLVCPGDGLRVPDRVLLSIGGNDIGFGNMVRYYLSPLNTGVDGALLPDFCPAGAFRYDASNTEATRHCQRRDAAMGYNMGDLIGTWGTDSGVGARYRLLIRALETYLKITPPQIVMGQYPDPLRAGDPLPPETPDAVSCRPLNLSSVSAPGAGPGYDPRSGFNALKAFDPTDVTEEWELNLTAAEAPLVLGQTEQFRRQVAVMGRVTGITFACGTRDAMLGHGWWQGVKMNLPTHGSAFARWHPSEWQPYAWSPNGRAVRTANDSFLTQMTGSGDQHGTMHPNLIGHTLMADAVWKRLAEGGLVPGAEAPEAAPAE